MHKLEKVCIKLIHEVHVRSREMHSYKSCASTYGQTDGQMDRHYQVHYLSAMLSYAVDKNAVRLICITIYCYASESVAPLSIGNSQKIVGHFPCYEYMKHIFHRFCKTFPVLAQYQVLFSSS